MSKYKRPFSVDNRKPTYIDSKDPRSKQLEKYRSRLGRKLVLKDLPDIGILNNITTPEDYYQTMFLTKTNEQGEVLNIFCLAARPYIKGKLPSQQRVSLYKTAIVPKKIFKAQNGDFIIVANNISNNTFYGNSHNGILIIRIDENLNIVYSNLYYNDLVTFDPNTTLLQFYWSNLDNPFENTVNSNIFYNVIDAVIDSQDNICMVVQKYDNNNYNPYYSENNPYISIIKFNDLGKQAWEKTFKITSNTKIPNQNKTVRDFKDTSGDKSKDLWLENDKSGGAAPESELSKISGKMQLDNDGNIYTILDGRYLIKCSPEGSIMWKNIIKISVSGGQECDIAITDFTIKNNIIYINGIFQGDLGEWVYEPDVVIPDPPAYAFRPLTVWKYDSVERYFTVTNVLPSSGIPNSPPETSDTGLLRYYYTGEYPVLGPTIDEQNNYIYGDLVTTQISPNIYSQKGFVTGTGSYGGQNYFELPGTYDTSLYGGSPYVSIGSGDILSKTEELADRKITLSNNFQSNFLFKINLSTPDSNLKHYIDDKWAIINIAPNLGANETEPIIYAAINDNCAGEKLTSSLEYPSIQNFDSDPAIKKDTVIYNTLMSPATTTDEYQTKIELINGNYVTTYPDPVVNAYPSPFDRAAKLKFISGPGGLMQVDSSGSIYVVENIVLPYKDVYTYPSPTSFQTIGDGGGWSLFIIKKYSGTTLELQSRKIVYTDSFWHPINQNFYSLSTQGLNLMKSNMINAWGDSLYLYVNKFTIDDNDNLIINVNASIPIKTISSPLGFYRWDHGNNTYSTDPGKHHAATFTLKISNSLSAVESVYNLNAEGYTGNNLPNPPCGLIGSPCVYQPNNLVWPFQPFKQNTFYIKDAEMPIVHDYSEDPDIIGFNERYIGFLTIPGSTSTYFVRASVDDIQLDVTQIGIFGVDEGDTNMQDISLPVRYKAKILDITDQLVLFDTTGIYSHSYIEANLNKNTLYEVVNQNISNNSSVVNINSNSNNWISFNNHYIGLSQYASIYSHIRNNDFVVDSENNIWSVAGSREIQDS